MTSQQQDLHWMEQALALARQAASNNEVPVGAVMVDSANNCIGTGYNCPISSCDPSAHAEMVAIRAAALAVANYRLVNTTLYVTLEPCLMCFGAIVHARIARVVYAAADPKTGVSAYNMPLVNGGLINHSPVMVGGLCAAASRSLLKDFFSKLR